MTDQINDISRRVKGLEEWRNEVTTVQAVDDERRKHMDAKFTSLERRFDRVDGHISKLVWLVVAAIVAGVAQSLMMGGG